MSFKKTLALILLCGVLGVGSQGCYMSRLEEAVSSFDCFSHQAEMIDAGCTDASVELLECGACSTDTADDVAR